MRATDEQTAIETSGADVLSSRKKLRKTLGGGGGGGPPPKAGGRGGGGGVASTSPLVRPRVNRFSQG